jgi:uncharacterized membrane protein YjjB (DUF3815 family)
MRTFFRLILNVVLILAAIAAVGWVTTLKAYRHGSHDARMAMVIGAAVVTFVVACLLLAAVKPKKKPAARRTTPYAATARRR